MNRFKKYFALTRAGIIECVNYRIALAVMVFGNLLYLTLIYFVWKAIFASSGSDVVNGMTFESTMIYLVLATALFNFMEMYIVWEIGRDIQSGKIALNFLERKKTDLILLDYEMPEENGVEVLRKLRANEQTKDIPVVFLTGMNDREMIQKILAMKPQGYLLKPIEISKLFQTIRQIIG